VIPGTIAVTAGRTNCAPEFRTKSITSKTKKFRDTREYRTPIIPATAAWTKVTGKHHISPIETVKIDAGNGSNEYRGKENSRDSDSHFERVAGQLEDIPYRSYIEDEVA
jgi:hypothetical protein